jgi:hypothetical protein
VREWELRPTTAPQTFAAQLGAQFRFIVALLKKEVQRVFDHGAFAHALEEGKPLKTVGEIDVECVRDFCHTCGRR